MLIHFSLRRDVAKEGLAVYLRNKSVTYSIDITDNVLL
jgi:hypothetical protein